MLATIIVGLSLTFGQPGLTPSSLPSLRAPLDSYPAQPSGGYSPALLQAPVPKDEKKTENGNGKKENGNGKKEKERYPSAIFGPHLPDGPQGKGFLSSLIRAYVKDFRATDDDTPPARRALPEPWSAPPFPGHEYQGYPLIGVPPETSVYPFMRAVYDSTEGTPFGDAIKSSRIKFDGWATGSGNWSSSKQSNVPASYWIVPNSVQLDQILFRLQREVDTVQTDHIDWGFRSVTFYGMDYRYTTAGGWFSNQLLRNNALNGWDPAEQYFDLYIPFIGQGAVIRVGRWIACPDIETQWAPDNYMGSHSLLFTVDTYTQTGIMWTQRLNEQWIVQAALHAGTDMAPWYPGAIPTGAFGVRWVSKDNNDAIYTWLNAINNAEFRHFQEYGQALGHDNFNYVVATWEHRFNSSVHTKTESYIMWERNAELGGTPSAGPVATYGGGGGDAPTIPGQSLAYGILNYTMFALSKADYLTVRNEWVRDETGFRFGAPGNYSSHSLGWSHSFNSDFIVRPEIGYYRNWTNPVFDNGTKKGMLMGGFDVIWRF